MEWQAMVALGAYHGINPGMGWLFAVALGMQQGSVRGVWRALPPIALGHFAAVGVVLVAAAVTGLLVPLDTLNVIVALTLVMLGLYRLWRHRHPRYGGMQVGFRDLTMWSFLMASAHGAGLMVLPLVMPASRSALTAGYDHAAHVAASHPNVMTTATAAAAIHTLAYFAVMVVAAWIVYGKLGLTLLRQAWINMDSVWAGALVIAGMMVWFKA